ncbi:unnamed protein product [Zymoseptoria tritici ST99CH_3D7]|uniref:Major facilitator superfamily (MFS) profile domain-containing protein n=1 Tax=Zymoseptoria tritici (strain ST99CH_3D7) TaxID=1276538 RepID=A0A1X7S1E2_ZYMT9|nr:unnamed protein product [Zymoseptoria tritici ST99CH_3D7]
MAHRSPTSDTETKRSDTHSDTRTSSQTDATPKGSSDSAIQHTTNKVKSGRDPRLERASSHEIREGDGVNDEQSPLLPARTSDDVGAVPHLQGVMSPGSSSGEDGWNVDTGKREASKSSWYLLFLTISFAGLQIAWSVELSNGSPYLLSLGISKSLLALVWIAGPLSGALVQPYVGAKSDRCRSRFGKRRPFMIGGAAATIVSLMILAWTRELVAGFLSIFGVARDSVGTKNTAIIVAIIMVYVLDFSINVIQAGMRAFVVDNAPSHQQDSANAWASRVSAMANIIGYLFGYANLPKYLWFFGYTQFQVLCAIASITLGTTLTITCISISERDPRLEGTPSHQDSGVFAFFKSLYRSIHRLPRQIKAICVVQFAAWIGWFPFLFYITTYVGEIYTDPIFRANPNMTEKEIDRVWEQGTRVGTFALLIFAIVTFVSSVTLPWFMTSESTSTPPLRTPMTPTSASTPGGSYFLGPQAHPARRFWPSIRENALQIPGLTLKRAWLISHFVYAGLLAMTFFAHTTFTATLLVGAVGLPWAMTMWAPFALIAAEVSRRENLRRNSDSRRPSSSRRDADGDEEEEQQAGTVLGIHNVAVAAPQVIATLVSSLIFKALQKPRGTAGDDSVAWVLRFGGLAAILAGWLTRWVREERDAGLKEVKAKF